MRLWILIGAILFLLVTLYIAFLPSTGKMSPASKRVVSMSNLRIIAQAAKRYAEENGNLYPPTLGHLLAMDIEPLVFVSRLNPNEPARPKPGEDPIAWVNANSDYHLLYLGEPYVDDPEKVVGIESIFSKDGAHVLYADGRVMFTSLDEMNRLAAEHDFELRYGKNYKPRK